MRQHKATRTLVKSPPELWSECSDAAALARHLGAFGEIKITRLEPQKTVAWEGETLSGTVELEPAGWGTRVTLAVQTAPLGPETRLPVDPAPDPVPPSTPDAGEEPSLAGFDAYSTANPAKPSRTRVGLRWLKTFFLGEPEPQPAPEPPAAQAPEAAPAPVAPAPQLENALTSALESLGQAHHRPFSRA